MKTKVIFRRWKDSGGIIAIFPELPGNPDPYMCMMYEHVGQHGSGDPMHVIRQSRPATPDEYTDLENELIGRGYDLAVVRKYTRYHLENRKQELMKSL